MTCKRPQTASCGDADCQRLLRRQAFAPLVPSRSLLHLLLPRFFVAVPRGLHLMRCQGPRGLVSAIKNEKE